MWTGIGAVYCVGTGNGTGLFDDNGGSVMVFERCYKSQHEVFRNASLAANLVAGTASTWLYVRCIMLECMLEAQQ